MSIEQKLAYMEELKDRTHTVKPKLSIEDAKTLSHSQKKKLSKKKRKIRAQMVKRECVPQKLYSLKYFSNPEIFYIPDKLIRMSEFCIPIDPLLHPQNFPQNGDYFSYFGSQVNFKRITTYQFDTQTGVYDFKVQERTDSYDNSCKLKEFLIGKFFNWHRFLINPHFLQTLIFHQFCFTNVLIYESYRLQLSKKL